MFGKSELSKQLNELDPSGNALSHLNSGSMSLGIAQGLIEPQAHRLLSSSQLAFEESSQAKPFSESPKQTQAPVGSEQINQLIKNSVQKIYAQHGANSNSSQQQTLHNTEAKQPLVGIIDTGFSQDDPNLHHTKVTLGRDRVDGDNNPLLTKGAGNEHGTQILDTIAAKDGNASLWLGRAVGSGKWSESLVEFVDSTKASGKKNAIVNLSFDLTQVNPDGSTTTRTQLTAEERVALKYAHDNGIIIVAAAGNTGGQMSALGQASQEFDNIITVGAAKGLSRADYSSYGKGLTLLADGTAENGGARSEGTSIAAAKVSADVAQAWAINPNLNYRQIIESLKSTATGLKTPGWNAETGAGLVNIEAALTSAKTTTPIAFEKLKYTLSTDLANQKAGNVGLERPTDNFLQKGWHMLTHPAEDLKAIVHVVEHLPGDIIHAVEEGFNITTKFLAGGAVEITKFIGEGAYELTKKIGEEVVEFTKDFGNGIVETTKYLGKGAFELTKTVGGAVVEFTKDFGNDIVQTTKYLSKGAFELTKTLAGDIIEFTKDFGNGIIQTTKRFGESTFEITKKVGGKVVEFTEIVGNGVVRTTEYLGKGVSEITQKTLGAIDYFAKDFGNGIVQTTKYLGKGAFELTKTVGGAVVEFTKDFGNGIVSTTKYLGKGVSEVTKKVGGAVVEVTKDFGKGVSEVTKHLADGTIEVIKHLADGAVEVTKDLGKGAFEVTKHLADGMVEVTKHLANGTIEIVNDLSKGHVADAFKHAGKTTVDVTKDGVNTGISLAKDGAHTSGEVLTNHIRTAEKVSGTALHTSEKVVEDHARTYKRVVQDAGETAGKILEPITPKFVKSAVKWTGEKVVKPLENGVEKGWEGAKWFTDQYKDKAFGIPYRGAHWVEQLPDRVERLGKHVVSGEKIGDWVEHVSIDIGDLSGLGEIYETGADWVKFNTRKLTDHEVDIAKNVFGDSINYDLVRIDNRAFSVPIAKEIKKANQHRPYTSFHTINTWGDLNDATLIHELTHVWQYEHDGSIYMPDASKSQGEPGITPNTDGYDYGGAATLNSHKNDGLGWFNYEAQAHIIEDYYKLKYEANTLVDIPVRDTNGDGVVDSKDSGDGVKELWATDKNRKRYQVATEADLPTYAHFVDQVSTKSEDQLK